MHFWPDNKPELSGELNAMRKESIEIRIREIVREEIERIEKFNKTASELEAYRKAVGKCAHCGK